MGAFTGPSWSIPGALAGADLSAAGNQYRFVEGAAGAVTRSNAQGEQITGVLYNDPASGQAADVKCLGVVIVEAGAAVAAGTYVTGDATGRAINPATTNRIHGYAVTAAAGAGEYITIVLIPNNDVAP